MMTTELIQPLALFLSLGGSAWFDALPAGPKRYEAIEMMVYVIVWRTGCGEDEARRAVSKAISEGRKEKTNG